MGSRLLTEEQFSEAVRMRKRGTANQAIGEAFGLTEKQVRELFRRHAPKGGKGRPRLLTEEQEGRALRMRDSGLTYKEIGAAFGLTAAQVTNYLSPTALKRRENPGSERERAAAQRFGVTPARYAALLAAQGGGCAVCGSAGRLVVDHDHACCPGGNSVRTCGKCVRGLLCSPCNAHLDRPGIARKYPGAVAAYLASPPARTVMAAV